MAKTDSKTLASALKKGELSRIYYIFGADVTGVEKMTKQIIKTAVGDSEDFALTRINGRKLDLSELADIVQQFPMMSEYNCILINDYNCEKPFDDMRGRSADDVTKKLLEILKNIPPQTVVIFNVTGFEVKVQKDFKTNQNIIKDKNKKLADFAVKNGTLCEFPIKTAVELSKIISAKVSARGGMISLENGRELAEMCLCDELVIDSEIDKLCSYADGREIDRAMIHELVHVQNDTTVYNLAKAVASMNAREAFQAVNELNVDGDNRGAVLYAITGAFIDMYRAVCAKQSEVTPEQVASDFDYGKRTFVVKNAFRDSSRMSAERLRECIIILRDTTMKLNSSATDPRVAIEQAITQMLVTSKNRR
ncbi:MAG: DNA polymerase III subunit delta [Ruminococcus flavefaciens]|nr:DNA polymerase III subunit delta [Ruminococcus flavefaciens]MCM1229706.1 DNA polymerase III subunit delta [Ruminococcus flavefaciens]